MAKKKICRLNAEARALSKGDTSTDHIAFAHARASATIAVASKF
jgi:hypothetical protein